MTLHKRIVNKYFSQHYYNITTVSTDKMNSAVFIFVLTVNFTSALSDPIKKASVISLALSMLVSWFYFSVIHVLEFQILVMIPT